MRFSDDLARVTVRSVPGTVRYAPRPGACQSDPLQTSPAGIPCGAAPVCPA
ncbi:hypothetical protein LA6_001559 [Marinibacterium anthonyi]|nr:hypothetical protein LA6_001559 [Marinibacterium anthonyi]